MFRRIFSRKSFFRVSNKTVVIHSVNNFLSACKKLSGFVGNVWAVPFNQEILGKDFFWLLKCSPEMTKFNFFQETMSVRVQVQHFRNYFTQLNIVREKHCTVRRRFFEQNRSKKQEIMVRCFNIIPSSEKSLWRSLAKIKFTLC